MSDFHDYAALNEAITTESEQPIVTKWLVLGEAVAEDGAKVSFFMSSEGTAPWDTLGLMAWHQQYLASLPNS